MGNKLTVNVFTSDIKNNTDITKTIENKLTVNIFTLDIKNNTDIIKSLGNIPQCAVYTDDDDDSDSRTYHVFCINSSINVYDLCKKYDCILCGDIREMNVDKEKYNNNYCINFTYDINYKNLLIKI